MLHFMTESIVVIRCVEINITDCVGAGAYVKSEYLPCLFNACIDIPEAGIAIPCRRHNKKGARRNAGQDFMKVVGSSAGFINEEAQSWDESMQM